MLCTIQFFGVQRYATVCDVQLYVSLILRGMSNVASIYSEYLYFFYELIHSDIMASPKCRLRLGDAIEDQ